MTDAYNQFDEEIHAAYRTLETKHLTELHPHPKDLIDLLRGKQVCQPFPPDYKLYQELDYITQELKYLSGMLHILRPGINNVVRDKFYYQTVADHRYLMHANWAMQSIYNFWDRIGDILWHAFDTGLEERNVFFDRVLNTIPESYKSNKAYLDLKNMYDEFVKPVLALRKDSVHYFGLETKHRWGHLEYNNDIVKLMALQEEKDSYAEVVTKQLKLCEIAYNSTLDLIDSLPDKVKATQASSQTID